MSQMRPTWNLTYTSLFLVPEDHQSSAQTHVPVRCGKILQPRTHGISPKHGMWFPSLPSAPVFLGTLIFCRPKRSARPKGQSQWGHTSRWASQPTKATRHSFVLGDGVAVSEPRWKHLALQRPRKVLGSLGLEYLSIYIYTYYEGVIHINAIWMPYIIIQLNFQRCSTGSPSASCCLRPRNPHGVYGLGEGHVMG